MSRLQSVKRVVGPHTTGYPGDHVRIGLLRCKGLICWRQWPVAPWLYTSGAKDRVVGFLRTAAPLQQWLDQWVGPDPA